MSGPTYDSSNDSTQPAIHLSKFEATITHPQRIGPYHILEPVGEGGMGQVYKAEQRHPIRRIVALKVIKLGMDTKEVLARFESERQALAMMNHPNVAKVFDAGVSDTGRPYFVMELVAGEPITAYCDRHNLSTRQRLGLFTQACDAVQHAHQKAILHRDIKPSNILVTVEDDKPVVKVIDFGVAKAVSQRLTEHTFFTETGQLIGTPEYMSPEQAEMSALDIDTRTDIYSLGVVLYELLSGALPFDPKTLRSRGFNEIQRIIREVDPPRPSTRISRLGDSAIEVARHRRTEVIALERELRAELEWIPLKALRKDRTERYRTATELADDIRNYLAHRPLLAGPESHAYRLRKFLRRNKGPVAAGAGIVVALAAGLAAAMIGFVQASRQRTIAVAHAQRADSEATNARAEAAKQVAINTFLNQMLSSADPRRRSRAEQLQGRHVTVLQVVNVASQTLVAGALSAQPEVEAALHSTIGYTYYGLGEFASAEKHLRSALALNRRVYGDDDESVADVLHFLGLTLFELGRNEENVPLFREALAIRRKRFGNDSAQAAECINTLALVQHAQGRYPEAEALYRESMEMTRRTLGPQSRSYATSLNNVACILSEQGKLIEAEPLHREALAVRRKVLGDSHPDVAESMVHLGSLLRELNRFPEAEPLLRQALAMYCQHVGDEHFMVATAMARLATLRQDQGSLDEAEALFRQALALRQELFGNDQIDTVTSLNDLACLLSLQGKPAEAEPLLRQALEQFHRILGPQHPQVGTAANNLGALFYRQQRFDEAEPLLREALGIFEKTLPADHWQRAYLACLVGELLVRKGEFVQAEPLLLGGAKGIATSPAMPPTRKRQAIERVVRLYTAWGKAQEQTEWERKLDEFDRTHANASSRPSG